MLSLLSWRVEVLHHMLALGPVANRPALASSLEEALLRRYSYLHRPPSHRPSTGLETAVETVEGEATTFDFSEEKS